MHALTIASGVADGAAPEMQRRTPFASASAPANALQALMSTSGTDDGAAAAKHVRGFVPRGIVAQAWKSNAGCEERPAAWMHCMGEDVRTHELTTKSGDGDGAPA